MQLYANPNRQSDLDNVEEFKRFMSRFEWADFYQPNPEKSPWHVQCSIETRIGYRLVLDFWPHKLKGRYCGYDGLAGGTVEGVDALRGIMAQAIDDADDTSDLEVIED